MAMIEGRRALEQQIANGQPQPIVPPTKLLYADIRIVKEVFQHRTPLLHHSSAHIADLVRPLRDGRVLEPVTVFWVGDGWVCIDGHHRLEAYNCAPAMRDLGIPVRAFMGSLDQAIARAAQGNTRDRLQMGRHEKLNAAWRLVVGTSLSKEAIVHAACVSDGSVASMRRVRKHLQESAPTRDLSELKWHQARREFDQKAESEEVDWEARNQKEAERIAAKLIKAFGKVSYSRLPAFAMGIDMFDRRLYAEMKELLCLDMEDEGAEF